MRPRTLDDLALWAGLEGATSVLEPPERLHAKHYPDGEAPGHIGKSAIIGPPFTRAFQRYLDGERPRTPIRRALTRMRSGRGPQGPEYMVCHAIVEDGHSLEHVRTVLRCSDFVIVQALMTLYDITEREKADAKPLSSVGISIA